MMTGSRAPLPGHLNKLRGDDVRDATVTGEVHAVTDSGASPEHKDNLHKPTRPEIVTPSLPTDGSAPFPTSIVPCLSLSRSNGCGHSQHVSNTEVMGTADNLNLHSANDRIDRRRVARDVPRQDQSGEAVDRLNGADLRLFYHTLIRGQYVLKLLGQDMDANTRLVLDGRLRSSGPVRRHPHPHD